MTGFLDKVLASVDSRVQILDIPVIAPGHCAICGYAGGPDSDGRKFIDWGLSLDFYGAVIFCDHCFGSVAALLGFFSESEVELTKSILEERTIQLQEVRAENDKLRNALSLLDFIPTSIRYARIGSEEEHETTESERPADKRPPQSTNVGGLPNVSNDEPNADSGKPEFSLDL